MRTDWYKPTSLLQEVFDDVKDPYQLHNLSLEENKEVVEQLYREMGAMLKEINDPWYTEKILSDRIPY